MYNQPKYQIYYFENKKNVALAFRLAPNFTCEIVDIAANTPGKGSGTIVYNNFEIELKKASIKSLFAFTRFTNNKAKKWYEKMGFTPTLVPFYYHDEPNNQAWLLTKML